MKYAFGLVLISALQTSVSFASALSPFEGASSKGVQWSCNGILGSTKFNKSLIPGNESVLLVQDGNQSLTVSGNGGDEIYLTQKNGSSTLLSGSAVIVSDSQTNLLVRCTQE